MSDSPWGASMSWADVHELRRVRRANAEKGIYRPPPPQRHEEGGYSYQEVMDEVRLILADTARFLAEDPESDVRSLAAAEDVASVRDDNRLRAQRQVPLGDFSMNFAGWVIRRADRGDFAAAVRAGWKAANGSPEQHVLGEELRDFVRGTLDGSITPDEVTQRQKHPRMALTRLAQMSKVTGDPVASAAAGTLSDILSKVVGGGGPVQALAVWEAFTRFAAARFAPDAPESLDEQGDLLLIEWGSRETSRSDGAHVVFVDLVRQFSILAEDGEYERMEQVHCSMSLDPTPGTRPAGDGTIWSNGDLERWMSEVQRSDCFALLRSASAHDIRVDHGRI